MTEAYCVKCQENVTVEDAEEVTLKNGQPAVQGTCPTCETEVFRMLPDDD
jgi:RNase P subunit RPR2